MIVILAIFMAPTKTSIQASSEVISPTQGMKIVTERCASCHAEVPTQAGFVAPPAGIVLKTEKQVLELKQKLIEVTQSQYMPLGNMTQMTVDERNTLVS
jgi:uncharacterized membrane protein